MLGHIVMLNERPLKPSPSRVRGLLQRRPHSRPCEQGCNGSAKRRTEAFTLRDRTRKRLAGRALSPVCLEGCCPRFAYGAPQPVMRPLRTGIPSKVFDIPQSLFCKPRCYLEVGGHSRCRKSLSIGELILKVRYCCAVGITFAVWAGSASVPLRSNPYS